MRRRVEFAVVRGCGGHESLLDISCNLLKYEADASVGHHVALSVVGCDRLPDSGYLTAKMAQEKLIEDPRYPTDRAGNAVLRSLQRIADTATEGNTIRLPDVSFQPLAADDVAKVVSKTAVGSPLNGMVEVGGPEQLRFDEFISRDLTARNDPREVILDAHAPLLRHCVERRLTCAGRWCADRRNPFRRLAQWLNKSEPTKPAADS